MTTFETQQIDDATLPDLEEALVDMPAVLASPFGQAELMMSPQEAPLSLPLPSDMPSPFTESFTTPDDLDSDGEVAELLLAELDDEEFSEALEALANEASERYMRSTAVWSDESGAPVVDQTEVDEWMESIATRADQMLAELESHFLDRSVESVTEAEIAQVLETGFPQLEADFDVLDAQELFWGSLKKKLKKVARAAGRVVKKGIRLASKFLPLGQLFRALRPIIKPLLRKVLAKAIGKLPRNLQQPARKLAQKFGLRPASEFENDFDYLTAEFDARLADQLMAPNGFAAGASESELRSEGDPEEADEPNVAELLDAARGRLVRELLAADPGVEPIAAMEQFIPLAVLPLVKTGIKIAGRKRVVSFVARLLAKLIRPMVGAQLAKPLSVQIADKGLALMRLETEAETGRLGAEALVAATEATISEVFSMPEEWLESELLLEMAVQESFQAEAVRHFPGSVLRGELVDRESDHERGVWVMMPRATSPMYRYMKYSRPSSVAITRPMARSVVFSDGETLEDRLLDDGVTAWPTEGEVHSFELLPGATIGHLTAFETEGEFESPYEASLEFDVLEEAGTLPLPPDMERMARAPRRKNRVIRVKVPGHRVRRKSPVSVRLDLAGSQPTMRLHLWVSERRAHSIVKQLQKQQHRDVIATLNRVASAQMRQIVSKRLRAMFKKRKLPADETALRSLSDHLFDGLIAGLGKQLADLSATMTSAAKDRRSGLTVTAVFQFPTKAALTKSKPDPPALTVRPGRHRD